MEIIRIPSKTFFLGEYAVLNQGPALVVNTQPIFEVQTQTHWGGFYTSGSVGYLVQAFSKKYDEALSFSDPHKERGGFGASTAQFLALKKNELSAFEFEPLLKEYKKLSKQFENTTPSGADLLSQIIGKVSVLDLRAGDHQRLDWAIDLSFFLIRTQSKANTAQHLRDIKSQDFGALCEISKAGISAFKDSDSLNFAKSILSYRRELQKMGLVTASTLEILDVLDRESLIVAAKGCGAMGADVIAVFCDNCNRSEVRKRLESLRLEIVATEIDIAEGLQKVQS